MTNNSISAAIIFKQIGEGKKKSNEEDGSAFLIGSAEIDNLDFRQPIQAYPPCGAVGQIDNPVMFERSAVIHDQNDRPPVM